MGNTFGLIGHAFGVPDQRVNKYWSDVWSGVKSTGELLYSAATGNPEAAGRLMPSLTAAMLFGAAAYRFDGVFAPEFLPGFSKEAILAIPKNSRPSPSEYLTQRYQDAHAVLFDGGAVRIQPSAPTGTIGRTETWVLPPSVANNAIAQAGGDVSKLEQLLGLDPGYLGNSPVRVDIPAPTGYRIPTGNEFGANKSWRPGGFTWPGGLPEAVINPVLKGSYVVKPVF